MELDLLETNVSREDKLASLIADIEDRKIHLSYSSIKAFMKSPRHFLSYKLKDFVATDAMNEGTLVDMILTEPEKVGRTFGVIPSNCSASTKVGVQAYCDFFEVANDFAWKDRGAAIEMMKAQSGLIFVTQAVHDKCHNIADKVLTNPASAWILKNAEEKQASVNFEAFGWEWKGRMDIHCPDFFTADLKKTKDADPSQFRHQIKRLRYPLQGAIYNHGKDIPYFIVGYDNDAAVSVIELKQSTLDQEWEYLARTMDRFNECVALGEWHKSYDFWPQNHHGIYTY